jgi:hypothetical protein
MAVQFKRRRTQSSTARAFRLVGQNLAATESGRGSWQCQRRQLPSASQIHLLCLRLPWRCDLLVHALLLLV